MVDGHTSPTHESNTSDTLRCRDCNEEHAHGDLVPCVDCQQVVCLPCAAGVSLLFRRTRGLDQFVEQMSLHTGPLTSFVCLACQNRDPTEPALQPLLAQILTAGILDVKEVETQGIPPLIWHPAELPQFSEAYRRAVESAGGYPVNLSNLEAAARSSHAAHDTEQPVAKPQDDQETLTVPADETSQTEDASATTVREQDQSLLPPLHPYRRHLGGAIPKHLPDAAPSLATSLPEERDLEEDFPRTVYAPSSAGLSSPAFPFHAYPMVDTGPVQVQPPAPHIVYAPAPPFNQAPAPPGYPFAPLPAPRVNPQGPLMGHPLHQMQQTTPPLPQQHAYGAANVQMPPPVPGASTDTTDSYRNPVAAQQSQPGYFGLPQPTATDGGHPLTLAHDPTVALQEQLVNSRDTVDRQALLLRYCQDQMCRRNLEIGRLTQRLQQLETQPQNLPPPASQALTLPTANQGTLGLGGQPMQQGGVPAPAPFAVGRGQLQPRPDNPPQLPQHGGVNQQPPPQQGLGGPAPGGNPFVARPAANLPPPQQAPLPAPPLPGGYNRPVGYVFPPQPAAGPPQPPPGGPVPPPPPPPRAYPAPPGGPMPPPPPRQAYPAPPGGPMPPPPPPPQAYPAQPGTTATEQALLNQGQIIAQALQSVANQAAVRSTLPTMALPKFDGNPIEFPRWVEEWTLWVNQGQYAPTLHMALLLGSLKGPAKDKIAALGANPSAFPEAMRILREAYSDPTKLISHALAKIHRCPRVRDDMDNLEGFIDTIANSIAFLRLSTELEPAYIQNLVLPIMDKLPRRICDKVLRLVAPGQNLYSLNIDQIIHLLREELRLFRMNQAVRHHAVKPATGSNQDEGRRNPNNQRPGQPRRDDRDRFQRPRPTILAQSVRKPPPTPQAPGRTSTWNDACPLCQKTGHAPDQCRTVPKYQDRHDIILKSGRCYRCLGKSHRAAECRKSVRCRQCNATSHHTSLCNPDRRRGNPGGPRPQGRPPMDKRPFPQGQNRPPFRPNSNFRPKGAPRQQLFVQSAAEPPPNEPPRAEKKPEAGPEAVAALLSNKSPDKSAVIMHTFEADLINPRDPTQKVRAFIYGDPGAGLSCIKREMADALSLPHLETKEFQVGSFGATAHKTSKYHRVELVLSTDNGFKLPLSAWATDSICPPVEIASPWTPKERDQVLQKHPGLLNPPPDRPTRRHVDVLLGMDVIALILHHPSNTTYPLNEGNTLVVNYTPVGPLLAGALTSPTFSNRRRRLAMMVVQRSVEKDVSDLFSIENAGIRHDELDKKTSQAALELFEKGLKRNEDGSYAVPFPFVEPFHADHDGRKQALGRLSSLYTQLSKRPGLLQKYHDQIMDLVREDFAEVVPEDEPHPQVPVFHLPHFFVLKEDSQHTKLRIVVDPTVKVDASTTFNELMTAGPNLLTNLIGLLCRTRAPAVVLSGDIRKAFLNVYLHPDHRELSRLIWLKDPSKPPAWDNLMVLRLTRIGFGFASSPFLLNAVLRHHFALYDSPLAKQMASHCYVDNLFIPCTDTADALRKRDEAKKILADAKMVLREFVATDDVFNAAIPEEDRGLLRGTKFLGHPIDLSADTFSFSKIPDARKAGTRRQVLSAFSAAFDPLQQAAPVIIRAKLVFHDLTVNRELAWDDRMPDDAQQTWAPVAEDLNNLHTLNFRRRVLADSKRPATLLLFSDASKVAHGVAAYVYQPLPERLCDDPKHPDCRRFDFCLQDRDPKAQCQLLIAKASVNPDRITDMPKLEMLAIEKAMKLADTIITEFLDGIVQFEEVRLYSDSEIALWQCASNKAATVYVRNRVKNIRALAVKHSVTLHHIDGIANPADLPTRGLSLQELKEPETYDLWFRGPPWTRGSKDMFPTWKPEDPKPEDPNNQDPNKGSDLEDDDGNQVAPDKFLCLIANHRERALKNEAPGPFNLMASLHENRSLRCLLGCTAFIRRLVKLTKNRTDPTVPKDKVLRAFELQESLREWIRSVQGHAFPEAISLVTGKKTAASSAITNMIRDMNLKMDERGILRCSSRLRGANLPFSVRNPALLPTHHPFTYALIREAHEQCGHFKGHITLAWLRRKYWIRHGLKIVQTIVRQCQACRHLEGQPFSAPYFAPYPIERLSIHVAYRYLGLDLHGPIFIKTDKIEPVDPMGNDGDPQRKAKRAVPGKTTKAWVLVINCLVIRAVHLELLRDMSAECLIRALRRFFALRGVPEAVYSDNGTQILSAFKDINKRLEKAPSMSPEEEKDVLTFFSNQQIRIRTSPPAHPASNGCNEAMVRLAHQVLRRISKGSVLTEDQTRTILTEAATLINSRPLLAIGTDIDDAQIVTPNHFLAPSTRLTLPPSPEHLEDEAMDPTYSQERLPRIWQAAEQRLDQAWKELMKQLPSVLIDERRTRFKLRPGEVQRSPQEGEIVWIKRDDQKRYQYEMGRIVEILPSEDPHLPRVAKVKVKSGNILRNHIRNLIPILHEPPPSRPPPNKVPRIPPLNEHGNKENKEEDEPDVKKGKNTAKPHQVDPNLDASESEEEPDFPSVERDRPQLSLMQRRGPPRPSVHQLMAAQDAVREDFTDEKRPSIPWRDHSIPRIQPVHFLYKRVVSALYARMDRIHERQEEMEETAVKDDDAEPTNTPMFRTWVSEDNASCVPYIRNATKGPRKHPRSIPPPEQDYSGIPRVRWTPQLALTFMSVILFACLGGSQAAGITLQPTTPPLPFGAITPPEHLQFQICLEDPHGGTPVALPDRPTPCRSRKKPDANIIRSNATLFTPSGKLPVVPAVRCYLEIAHVATFTSFFGGKGIVEDTRGSVQVLPVSTGECKLARDQGVYRGQRLHPVAENTNSTANALDVAYRWCCYAHESFVENLVVTSGHVAVADHNTLVSNLGSMAGCSLSDLKCRSDKHVIIWEKTDVDDYCPYKDHGVHEVSLHGHLAVIPELQSALTLKGVNGNYSYIRTGCLPPGVYFTEEGPAISFHDDSAVYKTYFAEKSPRAEEPTATAWTISRQARRLLPPERARTSRPANAKNYAAVQSMFNRMDATNAKLNYLAEKLEEEVTDRFNALHHYYCNLAVHQLDLNLQLIELDATRGIRALTGLHNISATLHGRVAYIHACHNASVKLVFPRHQLPGSDVCYQFTPVLLEDDSLYFLPPNTGDLVPTSPVIECYRVHEALFPSREDEQTGVKTWNTITGRLHVSDLAVRGQPLLDNPLTFSAPPLFNARVLYPSSALSAYAARYEQMERTLHAVVNYTAELSLHPSAVRDTLIAAGQGLDSLAGKVSHGIQGVANTVWGAVRGLGNFVLKPIFTVLLYLFIAIATIAFIILAIYVSCYTVAGRRILRRILRRRRRQPPQACGDDDLETQDLFPDYVLVSRRNREMESMPQDHEAVDPGESEVLLRDQGKTATIRRTPSSISRRRSQPPALMHYHGDPSTLISLDTRERAPVAAPTPNEPGSSGPVVKIADKKKKKPKH